MQYAEALMVLGQHDRGVEKVRPILAKLQAASAANPDDDRVTGTLMYAQALVGDREGATATINRMLKQQPTRPLRMQYFARANIGIVYSWIGEKDKAVDMLEPLLTLPTATTNSVYSLRFDIDFSPLRGFPRWEKLLDDPASSKAFTY